MRIKDFESVEYVNLVTFKKDGSSITTPVWVAPYQNSLVVTTSLNAGKVKRIKNNGKATIYVTNQTGSKKLSESLDVSASLISDSKDKSEAVEKIKKKYGLISKMFLRGPDEQRAIIQLDEIGGE
jgi:PPOX class probable F420-dependent enzyme